MIDVTDDVIIVTEPPTVAPGAVSIETDVIYGKGSGHNKFLQSTFFIHVTLVFLRSVQTLFTLQSSELQQESYAKFVVK